MRTGPASLPCEETESARRERRAVLIMSPACWRAWRRACWKEGALCVTRPNLSHPVEPNH